MSSYWVDYGKNMREASESHIIREINRIYSSDEKSVEMTQKDFFTYVRMAAFGEIHKEVKNILRRVKVASTYNDTLYPYEEICGTWNVSPKTIAEFNATFTLDQIHALPVEAVYVMIVFFFISMCAKNTNTTEIIITSEPKIKGYTVWTYMDQMFYMNGPVADMVVYANMFKYKGETHFPNKHSFICRAFERTFGYAGSVDVSGTEIYKMIHKRLNWLCEEFVEAPYEFLVKLDIDANKYGLRISNIQVLSALNTVSPRAMARFAPPNSIARFVVKTIGMSQPIYVMMERFVRRYVNVDQLAMEVSLNIPRKGVKVKSVMIQAIDTIAKTILGDPRTKITHDEDMLLNMVTPRQIAKMAAGLIVDIALLRRGVAYTYTLQQWMDDTLRELLLTSYDTSHA